MPLLTYMLLLAILKKVKSKQESNKIMEYIQITEIAKEVRKDLKKAFPDIKFTVHSKRDTLTIGYTDGVTAEQVESVAQKYNGRGDFDSNYGDYRTNSPIMFRGEQRLSVLTYVWINRSFSQAYLEEVLKYAKNKYSDCAKDAVNVSLSYDGTARFNGSDFNGSFAEYGRIARRCNCYSSVESQEQVRHDALELARKESMVKQNAWKAEEVAKATARLEKELQQEEAIAIVPSITVIEPFFIEGKFAHLNKNSCIEEYKEECAKIDGYYFEKCKVVEFIKMSADEYDAFIWLLLEDFAWLSGKGGNGSTANLRKVSSYYEYTDEEEKLYRQGVYSVCVAIIAPNREVFLVDPQGFQYARYVAFVDQSEFASNLPKNNVIAFPLKQNAQIAPSSTYIIIATQPELIPVDLATVLAPAFAVITSTVKLEPVDLTKLLSSSFTVITCSPDAQPIVIPKPEPLKRSH